MRIETREQIEDALFGGAFFGGGGGGFISLAKSLAKGILKSGNPRLLSIDELSGKALVVTVSLLGSPASRGTRITPGDQTSALELFEERLGKKVDAFISCENGAVSTINGWLLSALTGRPVLDAPGNGRAHPMGMMGSMGLEKRKGYQTIQAFAGGDPKKGRHVLGVVEGTLETTAPIIRTAADSTNGLIVVIRHPVSISYVKRHGAPGAIRDAIEAGRIIRETRGRGGLAVGRALAERFHGKIIDENVVTETTLSQKGGFDIGKVHLKGDNTIHFLNEYLIHECRGRRRASFPDLIVTLDQKTGLPLSSGEMKKGCRVILLYVPARYLKLGSGVKNPDNYLPLEKILAKPLKRYVRIST